jgi:folate-binding protein YgfZ
MTPRYGPLPEHGCLEVRGADAAAFLHGQLSRTIDTLDGSHAPLAGWHDAKGRLRALFRVLRTRDRWLLLAPRDVLAATASKLKMFVLRAKVELAAGGDVHVAALVGADDAWLDAHGLPSGTGADGVVTRAEVHWIRIGGTLWYAVGARSALDAVEPGLARASENDAALAEIRLGVPELHAQLLERYVPQMLNLDRLDALSFDKGCYPGQEVIARVHHRGAVKRRMRRYSCGLAVAPQPGVPVLGADGSEAGEIVRAARAGDAVEALAVVEHSAAGGVLRVEGVELRELPLPYSVPAE